ncbi:MAG: hypothetical protein B7733_07350 [Myxococcales bacterium FL481]|nr:MAG: hypothetical protein B7733_07350 [Myxococcales bacterium FL481]
MNETSSSPRSSAARHTTIAPSTSLFFLAAALSLLGSVALFFSGDHTRGIFVGLWVPSILSAGNLLLGNNHDRH